MVHGARRVDGVAALLEHHSARGGGERLAGDRDPVTPVQRGLLCGLAAYLCVIEEQQPEVPGGRGAPPEAFHGTGQGGRGSL